MKAANDLDLRQEAEKKESGTVNAAENWPLLVTFLRLNSEKKAKNSSLTAPRFDVSRISLGLPNKLSMIERRARQPPC